MAALRWADLHPEYNTYKTVGFVPGCNDVFRVPILSKRFARELVEECENFGQWSGGQHTDDRLQGGYEPVPTQDIHLKQLGFDRAWYSLLTTYLRPVTSFHYIGYALEGIGTPLSVVLSPNPFLFSSGRDGLARKADLMGDIGSWLAGWARSRHAGLCGALSARQAELPASAPRCLHCHPQCRVKPR
jgi:hypothetical protein